MLRIEMKREGSDFTIFKAHFVCPNCNGIVWFFRKENAPGYCEYCNHEFTKLFGLVNGFSLAIRRYYLYGEEQCLNQQRTVS